MLPECIAEFVDSAFPNRTDYNKVYSILHTVMYKTLVQRDATEYALLHSEFLRSNYGSKYSTLLTVLKEANILQTEMEEWTDGSQVAKYQVGKRSIGYRINPDMMSMGTKYVKREYKHSKAKHSNQCVIRGDDWTSVIIEDMSALYLPELELRFVIDQCASHTSVEDFVINEQITTAAFKIYGSRYDGYLSRDNWIKIAREQWKVIVEEPSGKYVMVSLAEYIEAKIQNKRIKYWSAINNIISGNYYITRIDEDRKKAMKSKRKKHNARDYIRPNYRVHHNFTELPSSLFQAVKELNGLAEIDMRNSQFAILGFALQLAEIDTPDAMKFREWAATGKLYDNLQTEFGMSREDVKQMMMLLSFSKNEYNPPEKARFAKMFPSVAEFIKQFKMKKGYNELAIHLQIVESKLFVDTLYPAIRARYGWVLTRHDSLIVRKEMAVQIKRYVEDVVAAIAFKCRLQIVE
jgi:hypothetical protein